MTACSRCRRSDFSLAETWPAISAAGVPGRATLLLGQVISGLEYRSIGEIVDDLPANMAAVQRATSATSEAIRSRYFPANALPVWVGESS